MTDATRRDEGHSSFDNVETVELNQDAITNTSPKPDEAPDGGARAWLVAAGGSAIFFSCLGFSNSFGTIQEYYSSNLFRDESPDNIAWIGSLSAFLQFASGMVGGPLFDRFGALVRPFWPLQPVH